MKWHSEWMYGLIYIVVSSLFLVQQIGIYPQATLNHITTSIATLLIFAVTYYGIVLTGLHASIIRFLEALAAYLKSYSEHHTINTVAGSRLRGSVYLTLGGLLLMHQYGMLGTSILADFARLTALTITIACMGKGLATIGLRTHFIVGTLCLVGGCALLAAMAIGTLSGWSLVALAALACGALLLDLPATFITWLRTTHTRLRS